jgi:NAD(P)-dependent dehydrogenase (short-subunit alcohol dehydrogenase family)
MAEELRFDDRVAIVTGGGRGLGRAYALLLASRGAKVVVNDLGSEIAGGGTSHEPATTTADDIVAAGGDAVANFGDVSSDADAAAMVRQALDSFGRLDIVVNNAGIDSLSPFDAMSRESFDELLRVHVGGSFAVTQAAWGHLVGQHYGRVLMTGSAGALGVENMAHYCTAKAAIFGLTRALSLEGAPHGITANTIMPGAATRMMMASVEASEAGDTDTQFLPRDILAMMPTELVAPVVAWLVHESCDVTGEFFQSSAGRVSRVFFGVTAGYGDPELTAEAVRDHWGEVMDESGYIVARSIADVRAL